MALPTTPGGEFVVTSSADRGWITEILEDFVRTPRRDEGQVPFVGTTAHQQSFLHDHEIEFSGRAYAVENPTQNTPGRSLTRASSRMTVEFDLTEPMDFRLVGSEFDAATGDRLGGTLVSLEGPSLYYQMLTEAEEFTGTLGPGRYLFEARVISSGFHERTSEGVRRESGLDVGFTAVLQLNPAEAAFESKLLDHEDRYDPRNQVGIRKKTFRVDVPEPGTVSWLGLLLLGGLSRRDR